MSAKIKDQRGKHMKGKNYLLITSILIIAGACAGFIMSIFSSLLSDYWHLSRLICAVICFLFLFTGLMGLICRNRSVPVCTVFGTASCVLSILSIPLMFWIGGGTVPVGLILSGLGYFVLFVLYLKGVFLNKRSAKKEVYYVPADFIPLRYHS